MPTKTPEAVPLEEYTAELTTLGPSWVEVAQLIAQAVIAAAAVAIALRLN